MYSFYYTYIGNNAWEIPFVHLLSGTTSTVTARVLAWAFDHQQVNKSADYAKREMLRNLMDFFAFIMR